MWNFYFQIKKIPLFLNKKWLILIGLLAWMVLFLFWPMKPPFADSYSTLVFDRDGNLLRVFLAEDEQYRFPPSNRPLPQKYLTCLLNYEDKRYYRHPGVDFLALANAMITNLKSGSRIRGGSTITMQVARLSHPKSRTYFNKIREIGTAIRLNLHYSKSKILSQYASHVPMGGNIVGVESASYSYFGKPWENLTWAEAALFVVLPNAPSRINLEKGQIELKKKRDRLLSMLLEKDIIDSTTFRLSCRESLPEQSRLFPFHAPHFCQYVKDQKKGFLIYTSLDHGIQDRAEALAEYHHAYLSGVGVANLSVLIVETQTGKVRAYCGSQSFMDSLNQGQVDGVQAFRSTGSLLKPFLVAKALDRGPFTMQSVIQDVPTFYGTFAPQNASKKFAGLVTLQHLLIHSLNVPAVRLLNQYGLEDFYDFLKSAGLHGLFRPANGYGLPLILGGAEASLWELAQLYASLGNMGKRMSLSFSPDSSGQKSNDLLFSAGATWLILHALNQLSRPGSEYYWQVFNHQVPVAWKTGTSYGQKDGWAIGVNRQWTIGVWVGNFTGEGNASVSGAKSAAPLLFELFNQLTNQSRPMWFEEPEFDLVDVECCKKSGYPAGPDCPETVYLKRPLRSYQPGQCPFHRRYILDRKTNRSVCSLCWQNIDTVWVRRYIVTPRVRDIYQSLGIETDTIPAHVSNCPVTLDKNRLEIVYPLPNIKVFIPRDVDGQYEKVVFLVKHQQAHARCFWFLNDQFIEETVGRHELAIDLNPGEYHLTVQDQEGFIRSVDFTTYKNPIITE